jgi:ribose transport system permease protein
MKNFNKKSLVIFISRQGVLVALILLWIVMAFASPHFMKAKNILNLMLQITTPAVLGIGMTLVIMTGGIDLSVGSVVAMSGALLAVSFKYFEQMSLSGFPAILLLYIVPILIALVSGTGAGALNGFMVSKFGIPAFIMTFGMQLMCRGAAHIITNSQSISVFPRPIRFLGDTKVFQVIPLPIIISLLLVASFAIMLKYTKFGRYVLAFGGNREALSLSGVNAERVQWICYAINGFICGFMAIVTVGRFNVLSAITGTGYEMDAIAAVIVGGTSITGGSGSIVGTWIGALFIGSIRNSLNLLDVSSSVQPLIIGLIMVVAVLFDMIQKEKLSEQT